MPAMKDYRARLTGGGFAIKSAFADGAAADTDITITGIKPGDVIFGAFLIQPPGAGSGKTFKDDLLDEVIIVAANKIQFTTTATNGTNEQVLILWFSPNP
jgi:hypothetical protein